MYAVKKLLADQFDGQKTSKPFINRRNVKPAIAKYEPHGWNHLLWYGNASLGIPCALQAFMKRSETIAQQIQLINPEVLVRFTNQLNTTALLLATFR